MTIVTGANNNSVHHPPVLIESDDSSYHGPNEGFNPSSSAAILNPVVFLRTQDLGLLLLFIHQIARVITRNPRLFNELELRNFLVSEEAVRMPTGCL